MEKISETDKEILSKENVVGWGDKIMGYFLSYVLVPVGQLGILFLLMIMYLATLIDNAVEEIAHMYRVVRHGNYLMSNAT